MDEVTKSMGIACWQMVSRTIQTREETAETVVPDTMPDIARILDTDAVVYIRSKTLESTGVRLEGSIQGTVLYAGEGTEQLQKLELTLPVTVMAEIDGLTDADKARTVSFAGNVEARALNPRKIQFSAEVFTQIEIFRRSNLDLSYQPGEEPLEIQTREISVSYIASLEEKSFLISEELSLPPAGPELEKLLEYSVALKPGDVKQVGGKLILQGNAQVWILYQPVDGAYPRQETFSISFSQIMDAPEAGALTPTVLLSLSSCYLEPMPGANGAESLHLEAQVTAQVLCQAETTLQYMADAYSLHYPCQLQTETAAVNMPLRRLDLRETLRETLETADKAEEVLSCRAYPGLPGTGGDTLRVPVTVHILYRNDRNQLSSVIRRLNVEMRPGADLAESFQESAQCGETYASASGNAVEIRMPVELRVNCCEKNELAFVRAAQVDTDNELSWEDRPSVVVVRTEDASLWDLAKRYGSTQSLIESANPGGMEEHKLLLIPRAR